MNNIKINSNSKQYLNNLDIHDSVVEDINCNYDQHIVNIPLLLQSPKNKGIPSNLRFIDVKQLDISIYEPWGAGFYLNELTIEEINTHLKFVLLLNSGDKISIIAREMEYTQL